MPVPPPAVGRGGHQQQPQNHAADHRPEDDPVPDLRAEFPLPAPVEQQIPARQGQGGGQSAQPPPMGGVPIEQQPQTPGRQMGRGPQGQKQRPQGHPPAGSVPPPQQGDPHARAEAQNEGGHHGFRIFHGAPPFFQLRAAARAPVPNQYTILPPVFPPVRRNYFFRIGSR